MRFLLAALLFSFSTPLMAETPDLVCERRHPQERIVAKVVNFLSEPITLMGNGELVVYDVFDTPIERHRFRIATLILPEKEEVVHQATLYHGSQMAYCIFNVDDGAFR